jgi:hypothetical protein
MTYMMTIQSKTYDRMSRTEGMLRPLMVGMVEKRFWTARATGDKEQTRRGRSY